MNRDPSPSFPALENLITLHRIFRWNTSGFSTEPFHAEGSPGRNHGKVYLADFQLDIQIEETMASIFTRIINRELPGEIVYEDDHALAFLDINPKSEGHTLVVPKFPVASFDALPADVLAPLMLAVQKVARAVTRAMNTPHYNLSLNNGGPAGQVVFHVHFHIIPRHEGVRTARPPLRLSNQRMTEIGKAIREAVEP